MDEDYRRQLMETPRIGFLLAAGIAGVLTVLVFLYEDEIIASTPGDGVLVYVFLIVALIFAAMGLLLCYRVPRVGNKLLGYHRIASDPVKRDTDSKSTQYTVGFKSEGAADAKRQNSRRKMARHSRRKLAAVTREMQQQNKGTDTPDADREVSAGQAPTTPEDTANKD